MIRKRLDVSATAILWVILVLGAHWTAPAAMGQEAIGDTLTVIQRPLQNIPSLVLMNGEFEISCSAPANASQWTAELHHDQTAVSLEIASAHYAAATTWWTLTARLPEMSLAELYDLRVTASGGIDDTVTHAVRVLREFRSEWYFVHITDTHLPDHRFSDSGAAPEDSTEMDDLREVIRDINLLNPEFVLLTGDLVNEGELEDLWEWRSYTKAQRLLAELEVPLYLVAGNHDIGGWSDTPPVDGTARRNWWRFFGWPRLADPPAGASAVTQDYSFDYGPVHFSGLESYVNYDGWRYPVYGYESFVADQLAWLDADLQASTSADAFVLFYHSDFSDQINLSSLGVDMALSGHYHSDSGSINSPPFDLKTDNVCDGTRAYRLIRVAGSTLAPRYTMDAGASGQNLKVQWLEANNGTHDSVSARIVNNQNEAFGNCLLRFCMPVGTQAVQVSGGTLVQMDPSVAPPVFYVEASVAASSAHLVTVAVDELSPVDPVSIGPQRPALTSIYPNPFNPRTRMEFYLPAAGAVELVVFDLKGRVVARLATGSWMAGAHSLDWDGKDLDGRALPSGAYFVQLQAGNSVQTRKIVLTR